jgi:choline dehydrogenase
MHYVPFSTNRLGVSLHDFPGFVIAMNQSRPQSRGWLRIKSSDPREYPSMVANYLAEEIDRRTMIAGLRIVRQISRSPSLRPYIEAELLPGPDLETDDELLAALRKFSTSTFHPVGTCKMGVDPLAVVDPTLRVHGLECLRVADASIMPQVVSGNTNATSIVIGEKCADLLQAAHAN